VALGFSATDITDSRSNGDKKAFVSAPKKELNVDF
jgi:hypothetical protein